MNFAGRFSVLLITILFVGCVPSTQVSERVSGDEYLTIVANDLDPRLADEMLPNYLGMTVPLPGAQVTSSRLAYLAAAFADANGPAICVSVRPSYLLERGDVQYDDESWLENVVLTIDDVRRDSYDSIRLSNQAPIPVYEQNPREGEAELLYLVPGNAPFQVCYEADLAPGVHVVKFEAGRSSGDVESFVWEFEVVDE